MFEGRRYKVIGMLGKGGFGTVYRAEMLGEGGFSRACALKVLNAEVEGVADVARRLRDEARMLGMLRHRAIVDVDGLVKIDGRWTVVMEYVEGADVSKLIERCKQLPVGAALEILGEVAGALHAAYTSPGPSGEPLRLLHRDIKPQNIMLTAAGDVKVLDFGIARADYEAREAETRSVLFGSVGYMAPERFELEERAEGDIYSLGVVLYEMLRGEAYGKATLHPEKFVARKDRAFDDLRSGLNPTPPEVLALLDHMLAYDPDDRPSAREVESLCRDLRVRVGGTWLRDWAEHVVPPLVSGELDPHDFSTDVVTEQSTKSLPRDDDSGLPERSSLSTLTPDAEGPEPERTWPPDVPALAETRAGRPVVEPPALPESGGLSTLQTLGISAGVVTTVITVGVVGGLLMTMLTCCGMCGGG